MLHELSPFASLDGEVKTLDIIAIGGACGSRHAPRDASVACRWGAGYSQGLAVFNSPAGDGFPLPVEPERARCGTRS
jgi:hypothetical protein